MFIMAVMACLTLTDVKTCQVSASPVVYPTLESCMVELRGVVDSLSQTYTQGGAAGRCVALEGEAA